MKDEFEAIMVGTDFSEQSEAACRYAARLARLSSARLILTHVFHVAQGDMMDERGRKMRFEDAQDRVRKRLEEVVADQLGGYSDVEFVVKLGDPATQLLAISEELGPDLIVTGTRGHSQLRDLIMGSVAEKLARHAPCPVLIVR